MDKKQTVHIFGLGGTGIKITGRLSDYDVSNKLMPAVTLDLFDTSDSESEFSKDIGINFIKDDSGLSGSGGMRGENYGNISDQLPSMLLDIEQSPGDVNFLIFSSGGGSGSALAYVALEELLKEDKPVICFISNTPNNINRCNNASLTINSINNLAEDNDIVIPVFLYDTTEHPDFRTTDQLIVKDIIQTSLLLSGNVPGLDDKDRINFLNPVNVSDCGPGVSALNIITGKVDKPVPNIVSALTVVRYGENDDIGTGADTVFSGILTDDLSELVSDSAESPVNELSMISVKDGTLTDWVANINDRIVTIKKAKDAEKKKARLRTPDGKKSSGGFLI
jgi:hypothetical protein